MRIAFIVGSFPILSETWILNQVTGLLDAGHDVHIFARANPHERLVHRDVETYSLMERTSYFDIPSEMSRRIARGALLAAKNLPRRPGRTSSTASPVRGL